MCTGRVGSLKATGARPRSSAVRTTALARGPRTTNWSGKMTATVYLASGRIRCAVGAGLSAIGVHRQADRPPSRRTVLEHVGPWKAAPHPEPLLAEVPTATELFGFWDHQKYFISLAFREHLKYKNDPHRGARFLLGDGVGLGKTLQLGAVAKLIGTLDPLPILILAPKPLLEQWQEELARSLRPVGTLGRRRLGHGAG